MFAKHVQKLKALVRSDKLASDIILIRQSIQTAIVIWLLVIENAEAIMFLFYVFIFGYIWQPCLWYQNQGMPCADSLIFNRFFPFYCLYFVFQPCSLSPLLLPHGGICCCQINIPVWSYFTKIFRGASALLFYRKKPF